GIRDLIVTGVQTCALPICIITQGLTPTSAAPEALAFRPTGPYVIVLCDEGFALGEPVRERRPSSKSISAGCRGGAGWERKSCSRSEERRVGKECRARGSPG